MACVVMPSALLPDVRGDARQLAALAALFAALLTFVEYNAIYPGLIEFRDAPPYNRLRFGQVALTALLLSLLQRDRPGLSALTDGLDAVGVLAGRALGLTHLPDHLARLIHSDQSATAAERAVIQSAAGLSLLVALLALLAFAAVLRRGWPLRRVAFNVWVNLPTFDPTAGSDITWRLKRDAWVNILLGIVLAMLLPLGGSIVGGTSGLFAPPSPQTLVWTLTLWSFLPTSLIMRGMALVRVAGMITAKRRAMALAQAQDGLQPA